MSTDGVRVIQSYTANLAISNLLSVVKGVPSTDRPIVTSMKASKTNC